jgi:hypothetical protein
MTQDFGVHATQDKEAASLHQMKRLEIRICRARRAESQDGGVMLVGETEVGGGCGGTELEKGPLSSIWHSASGLLENFPSWAGRVLSEVSVFYLSMLIAT